MNNLALLTGSYGGLGQYLAIQHAQTGSDLILVGRQADKLAQQAKTLKAKYGIQVYTITIDLVLPDAALTIYETCQQKGWQVDILINNAGFGGQGDFSRERSWEQEREMLAVNLISASQLMKLFLPGMVARNKGYILNVASVAAMMPGPLQAVYFASKAYLKSLSNAVARELKDTQVRVTTLLPPAMNTGFEKRAHCEQTKLFKHAISPERVAKKGYQAMLKGKLNVYDRYGAFLRLLAILPEQAVLSVVYALQKKES